MITRTPCLTAHTIERATASEKKRPVVVTLIGTTCVAPAMPRPPMPLPSTMAITPATIVPCPTWSVTSEPPLASSWRSVEMRPARSGSLTSTPVSTTPTGKLEPPPTAAIAGPAATASYAQEYGIPVRLSRSISVFAAGRKLLERAIAETPGEAAQARDQAAGMPRAQDEHVQLADRRNRSRVQPARLRGSALPGRAPAESATSTRTGARAPAAGELTRPASRSAIGTSPRADLTRRVRDPARWAVPDIGGQRRAHSRHTSV